LLETVDMKGTLLSLLVVVTSLTIGCGSGDDTSRSEEGVCKLRPVATCTEDCTWTEVLQHDAYCAVCNPPSGSEFQTYLVGECGRYHVLFHYGVDTGARRYYDRETGELVGEMLFGNACFAGSVPPAGCEEGASFAPLPGWCDAYRVDGTGTKCCHPADEWETAVYGHATSACSQGPSTAAACGDYNVSIQPDSSPYGFYYDARTGKLVAVRQTVRGQTGCYAGPAGGFTAPTCPSPPVPLDCSTADGSAPTN